LGVIMLIACYAVLGDHLGVYKLEAIELGSDLVEDSFNSQCVLLCRFVP